MDGWIGLILLPHVDIEELWGLIRQPRNEHTGFVKIFKNPQGISKKTDVFLRWVDSYLHWAIIKKIFQQRREIIWNKQRERFVSSNQSNYFCVI